MESLNYMDRPMEGPSEAAVFHEKIAGSADFPSVGEIVESVATMRRLPAQESLASATLMALQTQLESELALDMSEDLARWHVSRLFHWIADQGPCPTVGDFLREIASAYGEMVRIWVPLWAAYLLRVFHECSDRGIRAVDIISRDAVPLFVLALELKKRGVWDGEIRLVELNRNMVGVPHVWEDPNCGTQGAVGRFGTPVDELRRGPLYQYLQELYGDGASRGWVETGYYGTIVLRVQQLGFLNGSPFFFFSSANPSIFGYCNDVLRAINLRKQRIPPGFAEMLGDAIEAVPKTHRESCLITKAGQSVPVAELVAPIYEIASLASYWSIAQAAKSLSLDDIDPVQEVIKLFDFWRQVVQDESLLPCIQRERMPPWRDCRAFLQDEFRIGPVSPTDDIYFLH